jgi:hypothetical protein
MKANEQLTDGNPQGPEETAVFDLNRPLLFSIAYRMLGSVMDAEDVVQEALSALAAGWVKTRAALNPIHGAEKVARFFSGMLRKAPPGFVVRRTSINGRASSATSKTDAPRASRLSMSRREASGPFASWSTRRNYAPCRRCGKRRFGR